MNGALAAAPVLAPLFTAALTVALARWPRRQRAASMAGALLLMLCCAALLHGAIGGEVVTVRFGDWAAPFAIAFRIDRAAALMLTVNAVLALVVLVFRDGAGRWPRRLARRWCTACWPGLAVCTPRPTCSTSMSGSR